MGNNPQDSNSKNKEQIPEFLAELRGCLWDNGTITLHCDVMGVPKPEIRWYKDGKELIPGSSLKIKARSKESKTLIGVFACQAYNSAGSKATFSRVYAKNFPDFIKKFKGDGTGTKAETCSSTKSADDSSSTASL